MKKYLNYAFAGAIALTGAVGFSSCSSSGEDVVNNTPINNPTNIPEQEFVKTQFAISLPSNVNAATTRMSDDQVQQANNSFRGMQDIVLVPFVSKPTSATDTRIGEEITLGNISATGGVTNLTGSNDNYKVYNDVKVPLGTSAFLFYAQADQGSLADFQNGKTIKNAPSTAGTAGYTFSPVVIYDGVAENTKGNAIATYLTTIAKATGWSGSTVPLKTLYDQFINLKAGSSASVQTFVTNLLNEIKGNSDAVSEAIITAIGTTDYATVTGTGAGRTVSFGEAISGYPANLNLPDGAAAVKWDTSDLKFVVDNTGNIGGAMTSYVYPAALWYTANTDIVVSNTKQADSDGKYPSGRTTWDNNATTGVFSLYADGSAVTPTTRSIALKNQIQYAVGRLDVTVKCAAGTLYDQQGNAVTVNAAGFPVSAILIGGQKSVDFTFSPTGTTAYTIYDNVVSGVNAKNGVAEGINYTLALETTANEDINIAIELTNNSGSDFIGRNGELIPKGGKFYLSATLTSANATTTNNKIFKQDFYTIANLTIKQGNASAGNTIGLANATVTIPDLRTPLLELGLAVDLHWQAGNTFDIDI